MAQRVYKLKEDSLQWRFQQSRAKVQIFGGGFGNGKTTSAVIKALQLAKDYPGSNGLVARSTYPKLNDTIRKEFGEWAPNAWKASFTKEPNQMVLKNGTVINFRYIAQQGKNTESSTSNLLSATYDWIVVDQIEDPEITEKDFLDLLGRLRGNTPYAGDDPTMPVTGPRWFLMMCNPTRNWVYRKLVKPLHDLQKGFRNPDLLIDTKTGLPLVELYEGSTYENADNLPEDFIATQESAYTGQMRTRFLLGEWGAFEGLVYPQYDAGMHLLDTEVIKDYLISLVQDGFAPVMVESYDHGLASPACYGLGFADHLGNVFEMDGFYSKEKTVEQLTHMIKACRGHLHDILGGEFEWEPIFADPDVFRRKTGNAKTVGVSVAGLFSELGIEMQRANNDILSGIAKVQSYLSIDETHRHPIQDTFGSPRLFFSRDLAWNDSEFSDYNWRKDTRGEYEDVPVDRNDHAMDKTKYMLSQRPRLAQFIKRNKPPQLPPRFKRWQEVEAAQRDTRGHRHAA